MVIRPAAAFAGRSFATLSRSALFFSTLSTISLRIA